jgi:hypothetical protein
VKNNKITAPFRKKKKKGKGKEIDSEATGCGILCRPRA